MKENIKKIIILDYSTGEMLIKDYDENIFRLITLSSSLI